MAPDVPEEKPKSPSTPEKQTITFPSSNDPGNVPCIPSPDRRQLSARSEPSPRKPGTPRGLTRAKTDYRIVVDRLTRTHTMSSQAKKNVPFLYNHYMDAGHYSWNKMDLFKDCHTVMWSENGSVRNSCRLKAS